MNMIFMDIRCVLNVWSDPGHPQASPRLAVTISDYCPFANCSPADIVASREAGYERASASPGYSQTDGAVGDWLRLK